MSCKTHRDPRKEPCAGDVLEKGARTRVVAGVWHYDTGPRVGQIAEVFYEDDCSHSHEGNYIESWKRWAKHARVAAFAELPKE